jgi:hypothetical protein
MSRSPLVSRSTRSAASDTNATTRPSAEMAGSKLRPPASAPRRPTLTRSVLPVRRSWTKTSSAPFVSPGTRFAASEEKATNRPSAEIAGLPLGPSACLPAGPTLTRSVPPPAQAGAAPAAAATSATTAPAAGPVMLPSDSPRLMLRPSERRGKPVGRRGPDRDIVFALR